MIIKCRNCGTRHLPLEEKACCSGCGESLEDGIQESRETIPRAEECFPEEESSGSGTLALSCGDNVVKFNLAADVGKRIYRRLVGDDSRYVADVQFRLSPVSGTAWRLEAKSGTAQQTKVNGVCCTGEPVVLHDGDHITLASGRDPQKEITDLRVAIIKKGV